MAVKDTWSAQQYNETVPFVYSPEFTSSILQLLDAQPSEKIWDFGCGSGEVTLELQKLVGDSGTVIGVDSSESMIQQARSNGVKKAFVADIQNLPRDTPIPGDGFDAVFSNAAIHWCKRDPGGVVESAKRVLKKGGRFVIEMGGFLNCTGIRSALHSVLREHGYDPSTRDPWYFPSAEEYQDLLEKQGFKVLHLSLSPRITPLKGNVRDWVDLFCRSNFLENMADEEANRVMDEVNERCAVDCRDSKGRWSVIYARLRVVAVCE